MRERERGMAMEGGREGGAERRGGMGWGGVGWETHGEGGRRVQERKMIARKKREGRREGGGHRTFDRSIALSQSMSKANDKLRGLSCRYMGTVRRPSLYGDRMIDP